MGKINHKRINNITVSRTKEDWLYLVYFITKTYLYNFDPLKAHFYIVKLGFTGVYIIFFLIYAKIIDCGYSLEPPRLCFEQKYKKYQSFFFYLKIFSFGGEIF